MGCESDRERLSEYLDKRLPDKEMQSVSEHLKNCTQCQQELESLAFVSNALNSLPEEAAPPDFLFSLRKRIENEDRSWFAKTASSLNRALEAMPLRPLTAVAAVALLVVVFLSFTDRIEKPSAESMVSISESGLPVTLESSTNPVPVEFASTNPSSSAPEVYIDTPTEFLTAIVKSDPRLRSHQVLPHPKGIGVLVHTPAFLYEVAMDPAEFPVIQAHIEHQGGKVPKSLKQARAIYPIYIRALPSPTRPLQNK